MKNKQIIKFALVGFNQKMASSIVYFLDKEHAQTTFVQTDSSNEEALIIVDSDTIEGQVYLTDLKSASHKILNVRFKPSDNQGYPLLMKPIIPNDLIKKLLKLSVSDTTSSTRECKRRFTQDKSHTMLKQALVAKNPKSKQQKAIAPTEEQNFYRPKRYLQGVLQRCLYKASSQYPVMQAHLPFGDVVVDIPERLVYLMIGQKHIRVYERLILTELVMVRPVKNMEQIKQLTQHDHVVAFDDLLWDLSFTASCGRLPKGTDVNQVMQLNHWPNLTRVRNFKYACQIAALWRQQPLSIRQVIEKLNIDHKHVYGFYAAAIASSLLEKNQSNDQPTQDSKPLNAKPSILGRLLSRLRNVS